MRILIDLFWVFFKIGLFTFGGGYAMLPLLQVELVKKRNWVSDEELMDYFSIGQCTPGIIAVNVATFVGYYRKGKIGAIVATMGMVTPSLIIIMIVAGMMQQFMNNQYVSHAFAGIRIAVVALILNTIVGMWKKGIEDKTGLIIFAVSALLLLFLNISAILIVVLAAVSGLSIRKVQTMKNRGDK